MSVLPFLCQNVKRRLPQADSEPSSSFHVYWRTHLLFTAARKFLRWIEPRNYKFNSPCKTARTCWRRVGRWGGVESWQKWGYKSNISALAIVVPPNLLFSVNNMRWQAEQIQFDFDEMSVYMLFVAYDWINDLDFSRPLSDRATLPHHNVHVVKQ